MYEFLPFIPVSSAIYFMSFYLFILVPIFIIFLNSKYMGRVVVGAGVFKTRPIPIQIKTAYQIKP